MTGRYDDIIDRPHPVSRRHPQMTMSGRAAQFSSFAALSGYEDAVRETARQTDRRVELSEDAKARLNEKLRFLADLREARPSAAFTCFAQGRRRVRRAHRIHPAHRRICPHRTADRRHVLFHRRYLRDRQRKLSGFRRPVFCACRVAPDRFARAVFPPQGTARA